jgi:hypothetical protein
VSGALWELSSFVPPGTAVISTFVAMQTSTKQIFERYFDQPMMLPRGLRQRIE